MDCLGGIVLPDWLFKEEKYNAREDNDKFIDKSIFQILKILSRIHRSNIGKPTGIFYTVNPAVKLISSIVIIFLVSVSRNAIYISVILAAVIISIFFLTKIQIKIFLRFAVVSLIFTAIMLTPSIISGNIRNSTIILEKVFVTVSIINILSYSTKWNDITKALKIFPVPDIFILVLEITLKYIFILGQSALEMLYALRLRSIGTSNSKYMSISNIMGNLFLRSKDMGEEMYYAMECRGFTGEYTSKLETKIRSFDYIYILCNFFLVAAFIFLR